MKWSIYSLFYFMSGLTLVRINTGDIAVQCNMCTEVEYNHRAIIRLYEHTYIQLYEYNA